MSKYKDPRGIVAWNHAIPTTMERYGDPNIFQEERAWHIKSADSIVESCPFCGSVSHAEAFESRDDEEGDRKQHWTGHVLFRAVCLLCGAQGPARASLQRAINEWNGGAQ